MNAGRGRVLGVGAVIALVAAASTAGCSGPPLSIPTIAAADEYPDALREGVLGVEKSSGRACITLEAAEGDRLGLVLPAGYAASASEPITLLDPDGVLVATVGDRVRVGGGVGDFHPDVVAAWEGCPVMSLWLTSPSITVEP